MRVVEVPVEDVVEDRAREKSPVTELLVAELVSVLVIVSLEVTDRP